VEKLIIDELGHDPAFLRELAEHFAGERLSCPGCAAKMSPVTLRGAPIDLCQGCGGAWLDESELSRLSSGRYHEVGAEPPPEPVMGEPVAEAEDHAPQIELADFENPIYAEGAVRKVLPIFALEGAAFGTFLVLTVEMRNALLAYGLGMGASLLTWMGYAVAKVAIPPDLRISHPDGHRRRPRIGCMVQTALFVPLFFAALNHALRDLVPEGLRRRNTVIAIVVATTMFAALLTLQGRFAREARLYPDEREPAPMSTR